MTASSEEVMQSSQTNKTIPQAEQNVNELFHESRARTDPDGYVKGEIVDIAYKSDTYKNIIRCEFHITIEDLTGNQFTVRVGGNWGYPRRKVAQYLQSKESGSEVKFREVETNKIQLKGLPNAYTIVDKESTTHETPDDTRELIERAGSDTLGLRVDISVDQEPKIIDGQKHLQLTGSVYGNQSGQWTIKIPSSINLDDPQTELEELLVAYDCNSVDMLDGCTVNIAHSKILASSTEYLSDDNGEWAIIFPQEESKKTITQKINDLDVEIKIVLLLTFISGLIALWSLAVVL